MSERLRQGAGEEAESLELTNQLSEIGRVTDLLERLAPAWGLSKDVLFEANLALDEIVSNIIRHGYPDSGEHRITVRLALKKDDLVMEVEDDAPEFNPLDAPEPDTSAPLHERRVGGLGIFLTRKLMNNMSYRRLGGKNILTLSKRL